MEVENIPAAHIGLRAKSDADNMQHEYVSANLLAVLIWKTSLAL